MRTVTGKKEKRRYLFWCMVIYAVLFLICCFFVNTHDDFTTIGTPGFKESLIGALNYGNGRYLGNTLVDVFTNRALINGLLRAFIIGSTIALIPYVTDCMNVGSLLCSAFLIIGTPMMIFREAFVWSHGFWNYVPPVLLLLLQTALIKLHQKCGNMTFLFSIAVAVIGFCAQLFVENSTVVNCVAAVALFVYFVATKRKRAVAFCSMLSSIIGAGVMFLLPRIMNVSYKMNSYRGVRTSLRGFVINALKNCISLLSNVYGSILIALILTAVCIYAVDKNNNVFTGKKKNTLKVVLTVLFLIQTAIYAFKLSGFINTDQKVLAYSIFAVMDMVFAVHVICVLYFLKPLKTNVKAFLCSNKKIVPLIMLAVISLLIMLVVYPIGARTLFVTYVLLSTCTVIIFNEFLKKVSVKQMKMMKSFCVVMIAGMTAVYFVCYTGISKVNNERLKYAAEQIDNGQTQLEVIKLPLAPFTWCANNDSLIVQTFNCGDPETMTVKYITYEEYLSKTSK